MGRERVRVVRPARLDEPVAAEIAREVHDEGVARLVVDGEVRADVARDVELGVDVLVVLERQARGQEDVGESSVVAERSSR